MGLRPIPLSVRGGGGPWSAPPPPASPTRQPAPSALLARSLWAPRRPPRPPPPPHPFIFLWSVVRGPAPRPQPPPPGSPLPVRSWHAPCGLPADRRAHPLCPIPLSVRGPWSVVRPPAPSLPHQAARSQCAPGTLPVGSPPTA